MKHIKASENKWNEMKGFSNKILLTEEDLGVPGNYMQLIKINPHETAKKHFHKTQTEIIYLLNKNGYLIVNDSKRPVEIGDVVVIEPNDFHEAVNDTENDFLYVAFKVNFHDKDIFFEK